MQVHNHIQQLPAFKNAVVTIGTFDGVHKGHQQILRQLKSTASSVAGETVVISFHPHPKSIVGNTGKDVRILNTLEEKIELLSEHGIDHLVVVPFTLDFAEQSADAYVRNFLFAGFHPHTVIIGYDHRFGRERKGDYKLLETLAAELGFRVEEIPEKLLKDLIISSTRIREALREGDLDTAHEFLGYPYFFTGKVVEGNKLGRTIGFPTANLQLVDDDKLLPGNGVYAVEVVQGLNPYIGMMNVGNRPTVKGSQLVVEVNLFDFDADIYGSKLLIRLKKRLRDEIKFSSLEALKIQLEKDHLATRAVFT